MQLLQSQRGKKRSKWRLPVIALGLVICAIAARQGWNHFQPRYLLWKQQRALAQAKEFIAKRDPANAQIALEVAFKSVPSNPDALRVAADMLEQVGAAQAMRLRRAVVQAQPNSVEDVEALVNCCLRFRDYNAARDAISGLTPTQAKTPAGLRAALAFALATDNSPVADILFQQLETELPPNDNLRIAHNLLYLRHPVAARRAQAKTELETLAAAHPESAARIHRQFAATAILNRDYAEAKSWLDRLLADPTATTTDRLQKANIELLIDKKPFEAVFAEIAPVAARTDGEAAQFAQWLLVQGRTKETARWLADLPAPMRDSPAVKSVEADVAMQNSDWDMLAELIGHEAWGPISKETVRFAMAAHTLDVPGRPALRRDAWDLALDSARANLATLRVLQKLAANWRWEEEAERTLWTIARGFPEQRWAYQALFDQYRAKRDTKNMREVMTTLRDIEPSVPRYQHDWALLTLLLDPSSNWNPAKETMRQLYESNPTNPNYVTGYAFALAQSGKAAEALNIAAKLSETDSRLPARQPYLAFIYGCAKRGADLERCATLLGDANLLPEENYLFTRGRDELNRKPEKPAKPSADPNNKKRSTGTT